MYEKNRKKPAAAINADSDKLSNSKSMLDLDKDFPIKRSGRSGGGRICVIINVQGKGTANGAAAI